MRFLALVLPLLACSPELIQTGTFKGVCEPGPVPVDFGERVVDGWWCSVYEPTLGFGRDWACPGGTLEECRDRGTIVVERVD